METLKFKNISTVLIANRGEISSRVARTCRKMGIRSVAVYTEVDKDLPYVSDADIAVCIGQDRADSSFLVQDKIIDAAKRTGADAIHPGYGFLSENAEFAERCKKEGIIFIGPNADAIIAMGSKSKAKAIMEAHEVPTVPGYKGEDQSIETLLSEAEKIGYPLLIKATAGGGGKGMRIAHSSEEVQSAIETAKREAMSSFGDDELIIERYISSGRHIEFQIFGDQHGNVIHLLERECTIQRRYQKVVEESPSPVMSPELRTKMGESAVKAAKALNYDNAGTVEFIYDDKSGEYFFLEVNTRLQVEHPVTEMITGLDLVQFQIESAMGLPLSIAQEEVKGEGYAIELRLYAEDPYNDFLPQTGRVGLLSWPEIDGLRIESAIKTGSDISIYYDPMIAKIIVHDATRLGAIRKIRYLLQKMKCLGLKTNQSFLATLMSQEAFVNGAYDTHFIAKNSDALLLNNVDQHTLDEVMIAQTLCDWNSRNAKRTLLKGIPSGWRSNYFEPQKVKYNIGEEEYTVAYRHQNGSFDFTIGESNYKVKNVKVVDSEISFEINGMNMTMDTWAKGDDCFVHHALSGQVEMTRQQRFPLKSAEVEKGSYLSPMPSQVVKVLVKQGQKVSEGDALIVLNSMKMENTIVSEINGTVEEVYITDNQTIEANFLMLKIEEDK